MQDPVGFLLPLSVEDARRLVRALTTTVDTWRRHYDEDGGRTHTADEWEAYRIEHGMLIWRIEELTVLPGQTTEHSEYAVRVRLPTMTMTMTVAPEFESHVAPEVLRPPSTRSAGNGRCRSSMLELLEPALPAVYVRAYGPRVAVRWTRRPSTAEWAAPALAGLLLLAGVVLLLSTDSRWGIWLLIASSAVTVAGAVRRVLTARSRR